jgi:hypothetical protein
VLKYPIALLLASSLCALLACSRGEAPEQGAWSESAGARGDDAAIDDVRAGMRALAQPDASVEYVAAEMEGVIMARTKSQALMHYDGYRVQLTTPGNRVTRITFQLIEAKPTIKQLTAVFGEPREVGKGVLYDGGEHRHSRRTRVDAGRRGKPGSPHRDRRRARPLANAHR